MELNVVVLGLVFISLSASTGNNLGTVDDVPDPPFNLTIEALDSTSVGITWKIHEKYTYSIQTVELIVHSIPDGEMAHLQLGETTTHILDGLERSADLDGLIPSTQYQVHMVAVSMHDKRSNVSETITFRTLPDRGETTRKLLVHPGEITVVVLILIAWICAIALFLQKWGRIRIVHNQEPRFKREFKNLDTIKVVKRPTDSVIYRSYPRQFNKTMAAREKRIERMNTMPNIKIPETAAATTTTAENKKPNSVLDDHKKMVHRFKTLATLPVIEMDEDGEAADGSHQPRKTENNKKSPTHHRNAAKQQPVIELNELKSDKQNQSES